MDVSSVDCEIRKAIILLCVCLLCISKISVCVCVFCLTSLSHNMTLQIKFEIFDEWHTTLQHR